MKYDLTQHAQDVLAERGILISWVERVLKQPQRVEPDNNDPELEHRLARITEHGNRVLRVVVNKTVRPVLVITVYFDRAMRNKL